jgi:hypothetical protein
VRQRRDRAEGGAEQHVAVFRGALSSRGVSHDEVQSRLADYAAGTLAAADAERVRAHLASGCLTCLAGVFAKPVGLPRDLPQAPVLPPPPEAPPPETPPRRSPRWGMLAGAALIAGIGGAALVLGHGDDDQDRLARPSLRQPVPSPPPPKLGGAHDSAGESATEAPAAATSRNVWDDETPIIHARGDETTTSSTSPPAATSTSMPPPDEATPRNQPSEQTLAAAEPEVVGASTPSTAAPAADATLRSTTATPPSTEERVTIPTIPPLEIERRRLRRLLEASQAELDERTRELEDATDRARAADAKSVEQAKAIAALEAQLAEARRRADDLERKQSRWRDGD